MQQRQFTSGSRQAPDPYDQFLEEHQFYRKHTARDASCLFRVISEQMYDTQLHHLAIREKCVTYMRRHRQFFEHLVDRDYDEYLDDMSKPKTYGTLLELQAAGSLFARNVILFEPFDLGKYFTDHRSYFKDVFRVFYTPERHFDSVFTSEYIQEAAICQSICYEILYKDLFKLPDVAFAVEQMLHGPNFENMEYTTTTNEEGYATRLYLNDGREFELDLPQNTNCILENFKLCHFHYTNFPRFSDDLQRGLKEAHHEDNEKNTLLIQRTAESFLPKKYMSCVRQLLQESITPFPYKVAKALDPNMYRNIEFDSWNEMRKEMKLQNWYNGDSNFKFVHCQKTKRVRKIFQVGAKCHVKLRKSEQDLYTCHIQEIAVDRGQCIVFVEQLGEKRLVPYENLSPLPPDQFKPWTVPYRFQRHMQKFSSVRFPRQYNNYRFKFNSTTEHHHHHQQFCGNGMMDNDSCGGNSSDYINEDDPKRSHYYCTTSYYKLKQYTHLENFRAQTVEFCTMPLTVEHTGGGVGRNDGGESAEKNGQQRTGDANENNRSSLRSSNSNDIGKMGSGETTAVAVYNGVGEDQDGVTTMGYAVQHGEGIYELDPYNPNAGAAVYMPDLQCVYPTYAAYTHTISGQPEEIYGYYSYDPSMAPAPAYVSPMNGYYYGPAPPGGFVSSASANQYIGNPQPIGIPAPAQNVPVYAQAPPPHYNPGAGSGAANCPTIQVSGSVPSGNFQSSSQQNTPSSRRGVNHNSSNTPVSGRINYDARKSYKTNGGDLPTDAATLRFFYNLGLDYYHQKQAARAQAGASHENNEPTKVAEMNSEDTAESVANDLQNIRLDENANQVVTDTKPDANNNNIVVEAAASNAAVSNVEKPRPVPPNNNNNNNRHLNTGNAITTTTGGTKNNPRRYSSRCFNNKDRPMQHQRHHVNSNLHVPPPPPTSYNTGHHQQQQHPHQQSSRNNGGNNSNHKNIPVNMGGGGYQTSTTPNSSRGPSHPPHQSQLQAPISVSDHSAQTSPMGGFDDAFAAKDSHNCNTPTSNNSNINPVAPYGVYGRAGTGEQMSEGGLYSGGSYGIPLAGNAGGIMVPVAMTSNTGPPPPYGIYAPHHAPPGYQATGVHPNFMNGSIHFTPPQPSMPPVPGMANSTASGSDTTETNAMDMMNGLAPLPCPSYPPPPLPYYYASGSMPPVNGGGPSAANGGVHLVAHMVPPPTSTNHTPMQQPFSTPHHPISPQGYYLPPPPPPPLAQQMPPTPQLQQPPIMTNNPNNNCARPDMAALNNNE
ncbi:uncharacterized protein LOC106087820 isoform X1 [Stomoxys calcitrans]|uniref:uncharacterized protein LOC106087820 isoform X1 n=1 Tax=Stomoxys calcitrans TaxID=35570 RepID=UPI0027E25545|nr:uncharacterized protein LOC106087820 isoform X1 [Stomoxys calcitrans]XP_013108446.2 uncharacterized protein LOC106087820 isoform X1 [Stomoxys calcitrans]XP_013108447.2 uncharacterized protein LOC106087820 isoform X1 [Stomoxys calcitrans]XP_059224355.1 uncharacterized protein LOC106087820 isoform X1 [Stomoxys calcitrans]